MSSDTQLTEVIIGAAYTFLNSLKPGLDEKLYELAPVIELAKQGLRCDSQKQFPVLYDSQSSASSFPTSSLKSASSWMPKSTGFNDIHIAQMLGCLNITRLKTALLLNSKYATLGIKLISNGN